MNPDPSDGKLLDRILTDKISLLREQIQDIENEIALRKQLAEKTIAEIDEQICKVKTLLYEPNICVSLDSRRRRTELEKQIQTLEIEKQNQSIMCWKDTEHLKRELRQVSKEYKEAMRRMSIAGSRENGYEHQTDSHRTEAGSWGTGG